MQMACHVNGNSPEIPTGSGFYNIDRTASLLATASGWTFVGTITIPALAVTGSLDLAVTATAADQVLNADLSMNHATATGVAVDATAVQLTTARTSGNMIAFRGATTSLAGDTGSVKYTDFYAETPTDGGGTVFHVAFGVGSGHDRLIDCSAASTGQNDIVVPSNVADALNIGNGTLTYWTLATTTASPGITETWAHTGTAAGHTVNETINHATQVGVAVDATAVQLTTARTAGYAAGYRAKTTSLAGDLNGVPYAGLYVLAPTDGGGAVLHSGLYVEAGNDYSVHGLDNVRTAWGTGAAGVADATMGWDATILSLLAAVDDSVFKIGNGTNSFDVWTYGNTASDYLEWDASASTLYTRGAAAIGGLRTTGTTAVAITAVTVLTLADSGGIFTVNQGAAYDIDLPSPTTGAGCRYLFQLVGPASNAVTITVAGAAATFEGVIVNDVTSVLPATGATLTFVSGVAALGDCIEIVSTSTSKYFVRAICSTNGGITIT